VCEPACLTHSHTHTRIHLYRPTSPSNTLYATFTYHHPRWYRHPSDVLRSRKTVVARPLPWNGSHHQCQRHPLRGPQHPGVPRRRSPEPTGARQIAVLTGRGTWDTAHVFTDAPGSSFYHLSFIHSCFLSCFLLFLVYCSCVLLVYCPSRP